jgi:hypothetical protein
MAIVHDVETALKSDSETVCASPLCSMRFEPSGLAIKPRQYCCDRCKQEASLIRRVAELYGLTVEKMVELLRGAK